MVLLTESIDVKCDTLNHSIVNFFLPRIANFRQNSQWGLGQGIHCLGDDDNNEYTIQILQFQIKIHLTVTGADIGNSMKFQPAKLTFVSWKEITTVPDCMDRFLKVDLSHGNETKPKPTSPTSSIFLKYEEI